MPPKDRAARLEYLREWKLRHPGYDRAWGDKNPGYRARWNAAHKDKVREYARRAEEKNPGAESRRTLAYFRTPRGRMMLVTAGHRRRARVAAISGMHSTDEWAALLSSYSGRCVYCLDVATTRDHVVPVTRGGTNSIDNIVPSCRTCNSSKGNKTMLPWLARRSREIRTGR